MNKPETGSEVFHEPGTGTWVRKDGVLNDVTSETLVDVSETDTFILRGKQPNIYSGAPWEATVQDDDESTPGMRRGIVTGWAY